VGSVILRHTFTRNRDRARAALRYYETRPRGRGEPRRTIFTATGTVTRAEAYRLLDAHQHARYLAHRLMLSPAEAERPDELVSFTRYVLSELEKQQGLALHWVAVEHRNTAHPHVHVILCGGSEDADRQPRAVRLGRDDHARIRDDGVAYCRMEARDRERWGDAFARAFADDRDRTATCLDREDIDR
jgi:type IV secretory pathway VirD2 relaxase